MAGWDAVAAPPGAGQHGAGRESGWYMKKERSQVFSKWWSASKKTLSAIDVRGEKIVKRANIYAEGRQELINGDVDQLEFIHLFNDLESDYRDAIKKGDDEYVDDILDALQYLSNVAELIHRECPDQSVVAAALEISGLFSLLKHKHRHYRNRGPALSMPHDLAVLLSQRDGINRSMRTRYGESKARRADLNETMRQIKILRRRGLSYTAATNEYANTIKTAAGRRPTGRTIRKRLGRSGKRDTRPPSDRLGT